MTGRFAASVRLSLTMLLAGMSLGGSAGATTSRVLEGADVQFFVEQDSHAARQAEEWRELRPADASAMDVLAGPPIAVWFGEWNDDITADVDAIVSEADAAGTVPVLVSYYVPYRDCGHYSAGTHNDPVTYREWIDRFAEGIGEREAVVILEPDALAITQCLDQAHVAERFELIAYAVEALERNSGTDVYIDAGHSAMLPVSETASRLERAGIDSATGFALNTSNFQDLESEIAFGNAVSNALSASVGTPFVIDTSRNGLGPWITDEPEPWCNPPERALGVLPTTQTGNELVDAFLWVKRPGESDGECRGGLPAGTWDPEYALGLVQRSSLAP